MSALSKIAKDFDPNQPRGEDGRWVDTWAYVGDKREIFQMLDHKAFVSDLSDVFGEDPYRDHYSEGKQVYNPVLHGGLPKKGSGQWNEGPAAFAVMEVDPEMERMFGSSARREFKGKMEKIKTVYRGITREEWDQAQERGYLLSDGRGAIVPEWEGTNAGTMAMTAANYLPRDGEGLILQINVEDEDEWFTSDADNYIRTRKRVPLDRIKARTPVYQRRDGKTVGIDGIQKANITWDGDGLQGAGQPRDRMGRWVRLPGKSALKKVGAWELEDGSFGVFHDGNEEPEKTFKSKNGANNYVARKIKEDAAAYRDQVANPKAQKEHSRRTAIQQERDANQLAESARRRALNPVPEKGRAEKKPPLSTSRFEESAEERLPFPGKPSTDQIKELKAWSKINLSDSEGKYAELLARLMQRKGITQDPAVRGEMAEKYGSSSKRLKEVEQKVHDFLFPSGQKEGPKKPAVNIEGGRGRVTTQQRKTMLDNGARKGISLAGNAERPEYMFKANRGENRGKFMKVSRNGSLSPMSEEDARNAAVESKRFWTNWHTNNAARNEELRARKREEQARLGAESAANREQIKERKINAARAWARENGYDEEDSYWWAFFWNDTTLLKVQHDDAQGKKIMGEPIAMPQAERRKMDPKMLEGLLALPDDFDTRKMRGFRPEGPNANKNDEDFVEASSESRTTDPEWESRQRDRQIKYDNLMKKRFEKYKARRPGSKMSFIQFKQNFEQGITKALIGWDGDGVQGAGQPRGRRGQWTRGTGGLSSLAEALSTSPPKGATSRGGASPKGTAQNFDKKKQTIAAGLKPEKPQKGSTHVTSPGGQEVKRATQYGIEEAYYHRNNGAKKITNERLKEIFEDRTKVTQDEFDLISSAKTDKRFDGTDLIRIQAVRSGGAARVNERYVLMKNLKTLLGQDYVKRSGKAERGAGGQVLLHGKEDKRAAAQRNKDNVKRAANMRNTVNAQVRSQMLNDFGDGKRAKCIICGKSVNASEISPERMKPGPMGGKYERGNIAPAHVSCNTATATEAQYKPEEYYQKRMAQFLKVYNKEISAGKLGFVFQKNRKALAGKRPKK